MYKITYRMRNDVITAFLAGIILLAFSFVFYLMFSLRLDVVIYFSIIWFVVAIIRLKKKTLIITPEYISKDSDTFLIKQTISWGDIKDFILYSNMLIIEDYNKKKLYVSIRHLCNRKDWRKTKNEFLKIARLHNFKLIKENEEKAIYTSVDEEPRIFGTRKRE